MKRFRYAHVITSDAYIMEQYNGPGSRWPWLPLKIQKHSARLKNTIQQMKLNIHRLPTSPWKNHGLRPRSLPIIGRSVMVIVGVMLAAQTARATSSYVSQIPNGSAFSCANCHINPAGGGTRNGFGTAFANNSHVWNAALAIP